MRSVTLILPLPPSVNSYYFNMGNRRAIGKAGRDYKNIVANYIQDNGIESFGNTRLYMHLQLSFRDKRKADIDNRTKSLWDALKSAGLYMDDEQFDSFFVERVPIKKGGECVVLIKEME